jgi:hypothetical protein
VTAWYEQTAPALDDLAVASLGELTTMELAGRRASLLGALSSAPPGGADGALAAALALAAVIAEQDQRVRAYAGHRDTTYRCICGYRCVGLDALDSHLDAFPDDNSHDEAWVQDAGDSRHALIAGCSASPADTGKIYSRRDSG